MASPVVSMLAELDTWPVGCSGGSIFSYLTFLGSPGDWENLDILDEEVATEPAERFLLNGADAELRSELL